MENNIKAWLYDIIVHRYDSVSDEIVWAIIVTHLPKLRSEIEQLIVE
jgi:uncharacterized protein with HEPN domain